jgi:aldose 1-epimerase
MPAPHPQTIVLDASPLRLGVVPETGGGIGEFSLALANGSRLPLLRSPPESWRNNVLALGNFPLVPFSNRIAAGTFHFMGKKVTLPCNLPPNALHGQGWQVPWQVLSHVENQQLTLGYHHLAGDWPWEYQTQQIFTLTSQRLTVSQKLRNLSPHPMPAGLGAHPYFMRRPGVRLTTRFEGVWLADAQMIPHQKIALPAPWQAKDGMEITDSLGLDHCFTGWDGLALIDYPDVRLRLRLIGSALYRHLVLYTPGGEDFFCVEPVSHMNDAINQAGRGVSGTGLQSLDQHEEMETHFCIDYQWLT